MSNDALPTKGDDIRKAYLDFFAAKNHLVMPSASLVPAGDPTLLLTSAGMAPFKPYYAGDEEPPSRRMTSCQKCFRATDIDIVGDATHHTMFEMLGNFSIGDYFKRDAIKWAWEFVTDILKLAPERIWATVHHSDDEARRIWIEESSVPDHRIIALGDKDNFWGPAGDEGACGPSSELHYDLGASLDPAAKPGDDTNRYVEIWNLVFPQFHQAQDGSRTNLPAPGIDTGMGLERITAIMQGVPSAYETDLLEPVRKRVEAISKKNYGDDPDVDSAIRIVTEHARAAAFLIADGVTPSNEGRGYVLRRVIRRAVYFARTRLKNPAERYMAKTAQAVIERMSGQYPELLEHGALVMQLAGQEEERFLRTLSEAWEYLEGISAFRRSLKNTFKSTVEDPGKSANAIGVPLEAMHDSTLLSADAPRALKRSVVDHFEEILGKGDAWWAADTERFREARDRAMQLTGREVFVLADTYGFPAELTMEVAPDYDLEVTEETRDGFDREMEAQRERGRTAAHFGGGRDALRVYESLGVRETPFLGYDSAEASAVVVGIFKNGDSVPAAAAGDAVEIVLRETPFYPEGGGQVGDTGSIVSVGGAASVCDAQKPLADLIVHTATIDSGSIAVGDAVRAEIDRDRRLDIARNHTATHLLHAVLRDALGSHVRQAGSLVAPERLRFDFTHVAAVERGELREIERRINEAIRSDLPLLKNETTYRDATATGALAFFGERYGDRVRTVQIGEDAPISFEVCGGTHLDRTGQIGDFRIVAESSVGAGVRRIEAVTGRGSDEWITQRLSVLDEAAAKLRVASPNLPQRVDALLAQVEEAKRAVQGGRRETSRAEAEELLAQARTVAGVTVLAARSSAASPEGLRALGDWLRDKLGSAVVALGSVLNGRPAIIAMVTQDLVDRGLDAGAIVREAARRMDGGGGGQPRLAQAGGKDASKLDDALASVAAIVERQAT